MPDVAIKIMLTKPLETRENYQEYIHLITINAKKTHLFFPPVPIPIQNKMDKKKKVHMESKWLSGSATVGSDDIE